MPVSQRFPRTLTLGNFGVGDFIPVIGNFLRFGQVVVPAQQEIAFGIGEVAQGVDTRRNIVIDLQEAAAASDGVIRLAITNANETDIRVVMEDRTENFRAGVPLGETLLRARQDSTLALFYDGDAAVEVVAANCDGLIPVTVYQ